MQSLTSTAGAKDLPLIFGCGRRSAIPEYRQLLLNPDHPQNPWVDSRGPWPACQRGCTGAQSREEFPEVPTSFKPLEMRFH
jgi:hypothetical protein